MFLITGGHDVDIDGEPTAAEWTLLVLIALAPPLIVGVAWLVSRLSNSRIRSVIAIIGVTIAAVVVVFEAGVAQLPQIAIVVAAILLLTASGLGSVLGWAVRMVLSHLATVGALAVRALPVVLLTAIVFFNGYVWLMATTITGDRLGLAMAFLIAIAAAFVVSATREWIGPTLQSTTALPKDSEQLADTPFATMPDAHTCAPLKRAERLNVVFVLAASQLAQILVVAVVTSTIYLVLGLIVLTPALLNEWTHTVLQHRHRAGMEAAGAGFADPYLPIPRCVDVHVHQRPRGRRRWVPLDIPRPADRRPQHHPDCTQSLPRRYRGCRVMLTALTAVINFTLVSAPNPQVKQVNE